MGHTQDIFVECSWILPEPETSGITIWTTSCCNNQTDEDQAENNNDFDTGQPLERQLATCQKYAWGALTNSISPKNRTPK